MIKKILHFFCFIIASIGWFILLGFLYKICFSLGYHINLFSPQTYKRFAVYWDQGGTLTSKDLLMFFLMFLYFPLCLLGSYKLYHFKFMSLLTKPLNWLANLGSSKYKIKNINIKNLKVEEKKTIEQIVQERLEKEKKNKQKASGDAGDFRKKIIEKIKEGQN